MNLNFAESIRRNPILYKCFAVLLLVVMLFSMTPTPAHAADNTVHIQCSINLDSWQVLTAVVQDQLGLTQHSPEVRRVDSGTLEKMAKGSSSMSAGIEALAGLSDDRLQERNGKVNGVALGGLVGAGEKNRVLTFPSDSALFKDDSTSADYNKALEVNNKISFSLNQAFSLYLDEKKITPTPDPVKFRDAMVGFLRDVSGKASSGDTVTLT